MTGISLLTTTTPKKLGGGPLFTSFPISQSSSCLIEELAAGYSQIWLLEAGTRSGRGRNVSQSPRAVRRGGGNVVTVLGVFLYTFSVGDFTGSKRFTSIICSGVISGSYNTSKLILEPLKKCVWQCDLICHSGAPPILSKGSNILIHIVVGREKPLHIIMR